MGFKRLALQDGVTPHLTRGNDLNAKAMSTYLTHTNNSSFNVPSKNTKFQMMVVGGGGGGGAWRPGGGGAGGGVFFEGVQFDAAGGNVAIGNAGNGGNTGGFHDGNSGGATNVNGMSSKLFDSNRKGGNYNTIAAQGGGRGRTQGYTGTAGGCGGGAGAGSWGGNPSGGTGFTGGNGGSGQSSSYRGGGGGGMGADLTGENGV